MRGPGPERSADGTAGTASEAARPDAAHLTPASVRLDGGVNLRGSREKANFSPSERRAEMGLFKTDIHIGYDRKHCMILRLRP